MFKRFVIILIGILLILPITSAQDDVFCGDLAASDCDLLVQSSAVMGDIESIGFMIDASFEMTGLGNELGIDPLELNLIGDGHVAVDMSKLAALQGDNPLDSFTMMNKLPEMFTDLLTNMQAEMSFQILLPNELMSPGMPELKFDIIMLDGILYFDTGALSGMSEPVWMGIDFANLYGSLLEDTTGQMEDMDLSGLADANFDQQSFTTMTRMADETVMGQTVAVFLTKIDYGALFANESMQQYLTDAVESSLKAQGMDMDELGMDSQQFTDMMVTMFEDVSFTTTSWIGTEDYYVHRMGMEMAMDLDIKMLAEAVGEPPTSDMPDNIGMAFNLTLDLSGFNEPLDIVAPEGATIIDPAMFGL